jgi:8-oxo-dGTP pyrophosphatase MutT (NUDIX family)
MDLTPEEITARLGEAIAAMGPSSDGYAEIEVPAGANLKCAAVLLPLLWHEQGWHLLYTRRTNRVESHKGQVSFPGGACDEREQTPDSTALREAQEELGIRPQDVRVLGRLANLLTISSYRVTPVVGVIPWPYVFHVESAEVARVFTVPLQWLANPSNRWEMRIPGTKRRVYFFHPYDSELIWGATARITVDFLTTLGLMAGAQ